VTPAQGTELVHRHGATAAAAGKPVLLQEFGYSYRHADQPAVYGDWLKAVRSDPNCAGWTFWRLVGRVHAAPTRTFPDAENDPLNVYASDNGEHFDIIDDPAAAPATAYKSAQILTAAAGGH
jgi:mannan endo-1,4-beta-mannosidase